MTAHRFATLAPYDRSYFTALVDANRNDPSDPHSPINYAALGADLEARANGGELAAFARRFNQTTDAAMRALANFCAFKATGVCERLAGRIDVAQLAEMNAETIYQREITADNRW